jgi:hypothetical protein
MYFTHKPGNTALSSTHNNILKSTDSSMRCYPTGIDEPLSLCFNQKRGQLGGGVSKKKENDLKDVYRAEKTRRSKQPKDPKSLELERLQMEVIDCILHGASRNDFIAILQKNGLKENSDLFRVCLDGYDRWSHKVP